MKGKIKNTSIKKKFMLYGYRIFAPAFVLMLVVVVYYFSLERINEIKKSTSSMARSVSMSIQLVQEEVKKISTYIGINNDINKILTETDKEKLEKLNGNPRLWYDMAPLETIQNFIALNGEIKTFAIYPENGVRPFLNCMDGSMNLSSIDKIRETFEYSRTNKSDYGMIWIPVEKETRGTFQANRENKVVFYREIRDIKNSIPLCFIAIGLGVDTFENICRNVIQNQNEQIVVFNKEGDELCNVGKVDKTLKRYILKIPAKDFSDEKEVVSFWYKGEYVSCCRLNGSSTIVCSITPKKNLIDSIKTIVLIFIMILIVMMVLLFFLLSIMSSYITVPIKKLSDTIKIVSTGDFSQEIHIDQTDEIGDMARAFNKMVHDINLLINENYVIKLKEKENALAILQSQINPHFLYNTLNSLYWQAINEGNDALGENILNLSRLFQLVLSRGKKEVLVENEFELITHYLDIQKMRFNDKLTYTINLSSKIRKNNLPKLLLQPFVENSIEHGFANKTSKCHLSISGKLVDEKMEFVISDSGCGMTEEQLREIYSGKERVHKDRIGGYAIRNIKERIELLYGDQGSFEITSRLGKGTKIKIRIPVIKNEGVSEE